MSVCVCVSVCSQKNGQTTNIDGSNELLEDLILTVITVHVVRLRPAGPVGLISQLLLKSSLPVARLSLWDLQ